MVLNLFKFFTYSSFPIAFFHVFLVRSLGLLDQAREEAAKTTDASMVKVKLTRLSKGTLNALVGDNNQPTNKNTTAVSNRMLDAVVPVEPVVPLGEKTKRQDETNKGTVLQDKLSSRAQRAGKRSADKSHSLAKKKKY